MLDQMIAEDILCQEMLNAMLDNKPSETISEPVVPYSMSLAGKISTTHLAESFEYLLNITKILISKQKYFFKLINVFYFNLGEPESMCSSCEEDECIEESHKSF